MSTIDSRIEIEEPVFDATRPSARIYLNGNNRYSIVFTEDGEDGDPVWECLDHDNFGATVLEFAPNDDIPDEKFLQSIAEAVVSLETQGMN